MKAPQRYWYSAVIKQRFTKDPCEFDEPYLLGVQKIERDMRQNNKWDMRWIQSNTSRCASPSSFAHPQAIEAKAFCAL